MRVFRPGSGSETGFKDTSKNCIETLKDIKYEGKTA